MNLQPEYLVYRWMQLIKIPVSKKYIKEKFLSHPDYPSLTSITDTLDELGIENGAFVIDKEKFNEIDAPFIAHTVTGSGKFELISDTKKFLKNNPGFEKRWDGVALVAEKPERFENAENSQLLLKEKTSRKIFWFVALFIISLSLYPAVNTFSWLYAGLLLTTTGGLLIGVLIIQKELGISNEFTEQLCSAGKNVDCDAVMKYIAQGTKGSKFLRWLNPAAIGLADMVIIYFSSLFLLLTAALFNETTASFINIFSVVAVCALPVTFFSLYYQWRVVKKWCPLCLATVAVLWIQAGLLLPGFKRFSFRIISLSEILFTAFILATVTAAWLLLVKPALQKNKELSDKNFSLLRFKNNPEIFNALLQQQRKVDATPFENDLQLGNPDAEVQIMVACNPYCGPCAQTHRVLHEFVEKNNIGLTIRFSVTTDKKDDKRLQAVEYILKLLYKKSNEYLRRVLHDWYADMNFKKFSRKYALNNDEGIEQLLRQHEKWSEESEIKFTPTIFINGHELPKQYLVEDLKIMFRGVERSEGVSFEKYIDENELIPV